jgi:hypothetical protein
MSKVGQSADYVTIHAARTDLSPYPQVAYTSSGQIIYPIDQSG